MGNIKDGDKPRGRIAKAEYSENQYLAKINAIPDLSEAEENMLLTRWRDHRDVKARNKVVEANLKLVLPIAKATVKRFGFMGDTFMPTYFEMIAAGSEALMRAPNSFDPARGYPFQHYARRCIKRECVRAGKFLRSVVKRPYNAWTPLDMILDQTMPDPIDNRDYCGSRARTTTGSDRQDEQIHSVHGRLRPWPPKDLEVEFERKATLGSKVYDLRMAGLTLKETAAELGVSITTVWRHQQAYTETRYGR